MFEKEAEEYSTSSKVDYVNNIAITLVQQAFRDGAEFGYNKAIVEIKDAYEGNGNFLAWFENYLEGNYV